MLTETASMSVNLYITLYFVTVVRVFSNVDKKKHVYGYLLCFNFKDILFAVSVIIMLIEILLERNDTDSVYSKRDMFAVKDLNKGKNYFLACDVGEYGQDCGYNCSGNCLIGQACDPRDGTCLACAAGFYGSKCDQGLTSNQITLFSFKEVFKAKMI